MFDTLLGGASLLAAAIGLGFVILIHELGHYLFAKWAGVKVHVFSIGFGPMIWKKTINGTEYGLALLPLGGYVQMEEGAGGKQRGEYGVYDVSAAWRVAIFAGGGFFNLWSSALILLALLWYGMPVAEPVVGSIRREILQADGTRPPSPAVELGVRPNDRIVSIDGHRVRYFEQIQIHLFGRDSSPLKLEVDRQGQRLSLPADGRAVRPRLDPSLGAGILGIEAPGGSTLAGVLGPEGLDNAWAGYRIARIGDQPLAPGLTGQAVQRCLLPWIGQKVELELVRNGETRRESLLYGGSLEDSGSAEDWALGLPMLLDTVMAGSPAEAAGIRPGDCLVAIDGVSPPAMPLLRAAVARAAAAGKELSLTLLRSQEGTWTSYQATLTPKPDPVDGTPILGVGSTTVRQGLLPALPGTANPLAAAGLQPGDYLVDRRVLPGRKVELHYLRGGELLYLPFPSEVSARLLASHEPHPLLRLVGIRQEPSLLVRLHGQVDRMEAGALILRSPMDAAPRRIETGMLPAGIRDILSTLRIGDQVVGNQRDGQGRHVLQVVRGAGALRKAQVAVVMPGRILVFMPRSEVPLRLDSWLEAFPLAVAESWKIIATTGRMVPKLFRSTQSGGIDHTKSLAGPIGIFAALKGTLSHRGFPHFLHLLALLGLNLVLVNLLPIPIADGGRLLVILLETVARRRVPAWVINGLTAVGVGLVLMLFVYVIALDILRLV